MDVLDRADLPFPHSLPEFQRLFPDDAACAAYLEKARWGDGFACPHCGTAGEPFHFENRPGVLRCRKCRQNTGLTVGTVMERSHCSTPSAHCSASRATPLLQPMPSFTRESGGTLHVAVMGVNRIGKDPWMSKTVSITGVAVCGDQAGHGMVGIEYAVPGQGLHSLEAVATGDHGIAPGAIRSLSPRLVGRGRLPRSGIRLVGADDEVLELAGRKLPRSQPTVFIGLFRRRRFSQVACQHYHNTTTRRPTSVRRPPRDRSSPPASGASTRPRAGASRPAPTGSPGPSSR